MLVERGLQVMNVEVVGDAYAIASNYLRKSGAIPDTIATNELLLEIIVDMFHRGEYQQDPARQQGDREIRSLERTAGICLNNCREDSWKPPSTASCRPMICW